MNIMSRQQLPSSKSIAMAVLVSHASLYNYYYCTILLILFLHQKCLASSSLSSATDTANTLKFCTLCPGHATIINKSKIALVDGRTCGDLAMEAATSATQGDDLCDTFYQYMGYAKCECDAPISSTPFQPCQLCGSYVDGDGDGDGGNNALKILSNEQELFEEVGRTTCGQAQSYVSRFSQGSPQCMSFQGRSQSGGSCTCVPSTASTASVASQELQLQQNDFSRQPFCNLCKNNYHRVTNPDLIISSIGLSCSNMEYELAVNQEYQNEQKCSGMQNYLSIFCYCGIRNDLSPGSSEIMADVSPQPSEHLTSSPSKFPEGRPSIYPTSNPSNHQPSVSPSNISAPPTDFPSEAVTPSPTTTTSTSPSSLLSSLPTTTSLAPTNAYSSSPSSVFSSAPSAMNSTQPSTSPTLYISNSPSSSPSLFPSKVLSPSPSIFSSPPPSTQLSSHPSSDPSSNPSSYPSPNPSTYPSLKPSSFFERKDNCTELALGIRPNIPYGKNERIQKVETIYTIDLMVVTTTSLDSIASELQSKLRGVVSIAVSSCSDENNSHRRIGNKTMRKLMKARHRLVLQSSERIYFVDFVNIKEKGVGSACSSNQIISGHQCIVAQGQIDIYYSLIQYDYDSNHWNQKEVRHHDLTSGKIVSTVLEVFYGKLQEVSMQINTVQNITMSKASKKNPPITNIGDGNEPVSSASKALIGVAVVCSALVLAAIFIMARGRKRNDRNNSSNSSNQRSKYSQVVGETRGIIPDRHIRSDDSVSNSPTISSNGRRAMAAASGWDDGTGSDGGLSDNSGTSSKPSFTVQLEEASQYSNGIEASRESPYQSQRSSYLPSSVLKDLLDGNGRTKSMDGMLDTVDL